MPITTQRQITVFLLVSLPIEHAYTDEEIVDTLTIKSEYEEIKISSVELVEEEI